MQTATGQQGGDGSSTGGPAAAGQPAVQAPPVGQQAAGPQGGLTIDELLAAQQVRVSMSLGTWCLCVCTI